MQTPWRFSIGTFPDWHTNLFKNITSTATQQQKNSKQQQTNDYCGIHK